MSAVGLVEKHRHEALNLCWKRNDVAPAKRKVLILLGPSFIENFFRNGLSNRYVGLLKFLLKRSQ